MSIRTAALIVFIMAAGQPSPAEACVCVETPACTIAWKSAAAFVGRVIDMRPDETPGLLGGQIVRFALELAGRGVSGNTIEVVNPTNSSCGVRFLIGERYVIYASLNASGRLLTGECSARRATSAPEHVAYLKSLARPARGVRIFGTVSRLEDSLESFDDDWDRGPVAGARIHATGAARTYERTTGRDGGYDFRSLPAGTYTVVITPPRGLGLPPRPAESFDHFPRSVTVTLLHPSECVQLRHQAVTDSRITGVLLRPDGRPAGNTFIEVISVANMNTVSRVVTGGAMFPHVRVRTDVDGRYEFTFVPEGRYVIGPDLAAIRPHNRYYHPGTPEPSRATVVNVRRGSRIELPPFRLLEWPWPD